uniref:Coiled-coil domain-containing protein 12 n=1 Tax=Tetraselmis sp. GSL018 TaxID=582737 RepID=A0A061R1G0_9CHLO|mmetsp:Transcript_17836/g.42801  ORF Transcript_17836/g.42801 Transcript_17836/m.42801 type:complete len:126 (-) Transcript_17836:778-1155(-)|eukprot:CAMPEP_0177608346 /NCGR_PEP_ID=MMETSP0419_2-20121207/18422_1 /TAXON_ID=582737 /ORGANISM="Tetraselmis sp., Strain GSL018" /LENGTH=125 /DNA_ID=CAMNT_0019103029 /DNA_START=46 /DNA_END=423 /DNA_ORIENTATION=+
MDESEARKAKLKALREKAEAAKASGASNDAPTLKFRNYEPRDDKISYEKVVPANPPSDKSQTQHAAEEDLNEDLAVAMAPKKANWDLRRDVEEKLAKLERRTQRAIVEIMQEQEQQNLRGGEARD